MARKQVTIQSDLDSARKVEEDLLQAVSEEGYSEASTFAIKLAVEEGLCNAIKHGNAYDPRKKVNVTYDVKPDCVRIVIVDEGKGFTPEAVPDPTADENLERPCGRGIMLMKAFMDEVEYNELGNEVVMVKRRT
ncbi:MAG: ATP-binding protein [Phycisphaerae bacterium]